MVLPAAVKEGDPAFGWCYQFQKSVPAKNNEAWTAGMVVVRDTTPLGQYKLSDADNIVTVGVGIVAKDKPTTNDMGTIFVAPAVVYSKYVGAATIKNKVPVATIVATTGRWALGTDANSFAQIDGKAGQLGGSGFGGNDATDVVQNDIVRLILKR